MSREAAVAVIFESAYDAHLSKDIITVPMNLAALLGDLPVYLLTRPNSVQKRLAECLRIVPLGNPIPSNDVALQRQKEELVRHDAEWHYSACLRAAEFANFLFLVPHFGDPLRGSLAFHRRNLELGQKAATYIKLDANVEILRKQLAHRRNSKSIKSILKHVLAYSRTTIAGRSVTAFSAESQETLALYRELYPQFSARCHLVKNCPAFPSLCIEPPRAMSARSKVFIAVGRLGSPPKATDTLLDAWMIAAKQCPGWSLRLVGSVEDGFRAFWDAKLREYGMQDRVQWMGTIVDRSRLWDLYLDSRIFVLPSRWESSSTTMVEAISAGCGVVCTRVGDAALLLGSSSPCLTPVDDPAAFALAMSFLANSEAALAEQVRHLSSEAQTRRWPIQLQPIAAKLASAAGLSTTFH